MKKVLFCSEASYLATGYAVYAHEILKRLHSTGKYDLYEYANYGSKADPRSELIPWNFIGNTPENQQEDELYKSNPVHQWGGYKWEPTLLKVRPDIAICFNDSWVDNYKITSPFRRLYSLYMMPTIDSAPQPSEWVHDYEQADGIFTYTKWAETHLKTLSSKINYMGQASPAADYELFKPVPNKGLHKQAAGLKPDSFIIGTTMRNQKRKLFPNLIKAFELLLDQDATLREKALLYLHTSWPDMGWNIPDLIKQSKYSAKILVTYSCQHCGIAYPSTFNETISICKRCGQYAAIMPNTTKGVSREVLSSIYNLFDVYVQYHNQEGFGMPMLEAAACQLPIFGTNYSAGESVIPDCNGTLINVKEYNLNCEKQTYEAIPDNADFVHKVRHYYYLPAHEKRRRQFEARQGAMKNYSYDRAAQQWERAIELSQGKWDSPPDIRPVAPQPPQNLSQNKLVEWAICNILGKPHLVGTYFHTKILRDLVNGVRFGAFGGPSANEMSIRQPNQEYTANHMLNEIAQMRANINHWEQIRCSNS